MPPKDNPSLFDQLDALRRRLIERAYALDRGGQPVAADLAMETAAQLAELRANFTCSSGGPHACSALENLVTTR